MNAPCYKCEDRSPACHDRCAKYREWSEDRKKNEVKKEEVFDEYVRERKTRIERRLGRR